MALMRKKIYTHIYVLLRFLTTIQFRNQHCDASEELSKKPFGFSILSIYALTSNSNLVKPGSEVKNRSSERQFKLSTSDWLEGLRDPSRGRGGGGCL